MNPRRTIRLERIPLLGVYLMMQPGLELKIHYLQTPQNYLVPKDLPDEFLAEYNNTMDWLVRYHAVVNKQPRLQPYRMLLEPMSLQVSLTIQGPGDVIAKGAARLTNSNIREIQKLGRAILASLNNNVASQSHSNKLLREEMATTVPTERDLAQLVDSDSRNEFSVITEYLYSRSELSWQKLRFFVDELKYDQKYGLMLEILRREENQLPFNIVANYKYELICSALELTEFATSQYLQSLQVQPPAPFFGYSLPEQLGKKTADMFEKSFDMSYQLFSKLEAIGRGQLAQLAVLGGHRQRYLITISSQALSKLSGQAYKLSSRSHKIVASMLDSLEEWHPIRSAYYKEKLRSKRLNMPRDTTKQRKK